MEIIKEIGFQVIEILTLLFGILGMTFSTMLMFSPNLTQNLSNILNRNFNVNDKISFLDKNIEITEYIYGHHVVVSLLLIIGSSIALFFFYFSLDTAKFVRIFFDSPHQIFFGEIILKSVLWIGKIACLAGLLFGSLLMFAPSLMKQLDNKLSLWVETNYVIDKLDKSSDNLDSFFFSHPIPVGLTGAIISLFVILLSLINLLD